MELVVDISHKDFATMHKFLLQVRRALEGFRVLFSFDRLCGLMAALELIDETLPIINKTKAPKKGEIKGTKWKDPHPRRQKNHPRG
jgi:hypothetical protein